MWALGIMATLCWLLEVEEVTDWEGSCLPNYMIYITKYYIDHRMGFARFLMDFDV